METTYRGTRRLKREELRVGMIVRAANDYVSSCWKHNDEYVPSRITHIFDEDHSGLVHHQTLDGMPMPPCNCDDLDNLVLISTTTSEGDYTNEYSQFIKSTMSDIKTFFREMTATSDEKLLKKHNIENPIGVPTTLGLELMAEILYKENREKIIEVAKKMEEESKKERE